MKFAQRAIKVGLRALPLLAVIGCSINQSVKPVELTGQPPQVCIIKNEKVREGFLDAYSDSLKAKNVEVKTLAETASLNDCPTTSTYRANWAWDMALYMRYAEIRVYRSAAIVGEAVYDATWGGLRLDKFISAENKIRELVDELFVLAVSSPKITNESWSKCRVGGELHNGGNTRDCLQTNFAIPIPGSVWESCRNQQTRRVQRSCIVSQGF